MCGFCRCVQGRTGNTPPLPSLTLISLRISRSANLRRYFHYSPFFSCFLHLRSKQEHQKGGQTNCTENKRGRPGRRSGGARRRRAVVVKRKIRHNRVRRRWSGVVSVAGGRVVVDSSTTAGGCWWRW